MMITKHLPPELTRVNKVVLGTVLDNVQHIASTLTSRSLSFVCVVVSSLKVTAPGNPPKFGGCN